MHSPSPTVPKFDSWQAPSVGVSFHRDLLPEGLLLMKLPKVSFGGSIAAFLRGQSLTRILHKTQEAMGEFLNSVHFPPLNCVKGDQLSANANRRSSRQDQTARILLIHAPCRDQWNLR